MLYITFVYYYIKNNAYVFSIKLLDSKPFMCYNNYHYPQLSNRKITTKTAQ